MTLTTRALIADPVDARALFFHLVKALPGLERWGVVIDPPDSQRAEWSTAPGQGLPAWLRVLYAEDGPLIEVPPEDLADGEPEPPLNRHLVQVVLDTARGQCGPRAEDVHAYMLRELGRYLDELGEQGRPVRWVWLHEPAAMWLAPGWEHLLGNADVLD